MQYLQFIGTPGLPEEMLGRLKDLPSYGLRKVMAEMVTQITGRPHLAGYSVEARQYFVGNLGGPRYPQIPSLPGIILAVP